MKTYNSTNNKFTVTVPVDESQALIVFGYLEGNSMMEIQATPRATTVFRVYATYSGNAYTVEYVSDANGHLAVPLKKWIVRAGAGNYVAVYIQASIGGTTETVMLPINVVNGMSYNDVLSPLSKEVDDMTQGRAQRTIVPPNVMIVDTTFVSHIVTESSWDDIAAASPVGGTWTQVAGGLSNTITPTGDRKNEIAVPCKADTLAYNDGIKTKQWRLTPADPCADKVLIRWMSQTGATRQHIFPLYDIERAVDGAVSLMTAGDGYRVEKNVSNGFTVRLTGLTPYSYWYYADMLQSSNVHAAIDYATANDATLMASERTAVYVEGAAMVTPSAGGLYTFEVKIKYKHYDKY